MKRQLAILAAVLLLQAANFARAGEHWAFERVVRPPLPAVKQADRIRTPVDLFIEHKLEARGWTLAHEADRATLARRVSFDLVGLPPTPAELSAFLDDKSPDAYERLVERLLASPRYGERWGKFWLDAAGYADSNGYFNADSDRPLAYRYRDYAIGAFNSDKPFDEFVREQLAGDELVGYERDGDVTPEMVGPLVATHFLRNSQDGTGESDGNAEEVTIDRYTVLEGTEQIIMNCFMGITIQCARCHDHKFEPVSQKEYYGLQAILRPAYDPDKWVKPQERQVTVGTRTDREAHRGAVESVEKRVKGLKDELAAAGKSLRRKSIEERLKDVEQTERDSILAAWDISDEKRTAEQKELLKKHEKQLTVTDDELAKQSPEFTAQRKDIQAKVAAAERERPAPLEALSVLIDRETRPTHHLLVRGKHTAPGEEVGPGVPAALSTSENAYRIEPVTGETADKRGSGRRLALARWLTLPQHPLLARVFVNRVWQHHFGVGIVETPDNFGVSGAAPSHEALLDWLAAEFVQEGWSIKHLHRLVVQSSTYRQSSAMRTECHAGEPANRLLWRFPLRRLDAEALRDSMLFVAGDLDLRMFGPYVPTQRSGEGLVAADEKHPGARRRSIYLQQRRTQTDSLLDLFDAPALVTTCGQRGSSTIPLQSLALLNSTFSIERAASLAARLSAEAGENDAARIERAFQIACSRVPAAAELAASEKFLAHQRQTYGDKPDTPARVWADFCQMILASNAFLYVE